MKFYDQLTKTAVFTSVRELLHGINCMSTRKVDEHSGHLTLRGLRITDVEGVTVAYTNPIEIFKGLKDDFGLPVDIAGSVRRGRVFRIKMTENPSIADMDMQVKKVEVKTSDVVEEAIPVAETESLIKLEATEVKELPLTSEIDWEWINSLENKKYDKEKLDVYAEEKHNIKLNKRNTLENMITDFKEQLESK
ncbi:hypothetical protein VP14_051 [Vibrio phage VPMCC14]|nr:hypothetical protein VP14_051 [Vibrio phage VPMCC14]